MGIARRLRWIAWFDLAVTALFVFPMMTGALFQLILAIEESVFGSARLVSLPSGPWSIFISIMGILGITWAIARLIVEDDRLCQIDALARLSVAGMIVYGLAFMSLPWVFSGFLLTELAGALAFYVATKDSGLAN